MKFIAVTGPQRSGKGTIADILVKEHGFISIEFSAPIEAMIHTLLIPVLGVEATFRYTRDPEYKEITIPKFGVSYRDMGRRLGSEWGRALSPGLWLVYLEESFNRAALRQPAGIVMPGLRLPVESEWVRRKGGEIWMVRRPGCEPSVVHDTESSFAGFDWEYSLFNGGTTDDLAVLVKAILTTPDKLSVHYPLILKRPESLNRDDNTNHSGSVPGGARS